MIVLVILVVKIVYGKMSARSQQVSHQAVGMFVSQILDDDFRAAFFVQRLTRYHIPLRHEGESNAKLPYSISII